MAPFSDFFDKTAFYSLMDDAVLIRSNGITSAVKVAFSNDQIKDELGQVIDMQQPIAEIHLDDAANVNEGDLLKINDVTFEIYSMNDTGDDMLTLMLRKPR